MSVIAMKYLYYTSGEEKNWKQKKVDQKNQTTKQYSLLCQLTATIHTPPQEDDIFSSYKLPCTGLCTHSHHIQSCKSVSILSSFKYIIIYIFFTIYNNINYSVQSQLVVTYTTYSQVTQTDSSLAQRKTPSQGIYSTM